MKFFSFLMLVVGSVHVVLCFVFFDASAGLVGVSIF